MTRLRWADLSIAHKLFTVVAIMATLIASELVTLRFAMRTLSSVRAFVAGEGLWSKAQKDAVFSLERYARTHEERDYEAFLAHLQIPEGDHRARLALMQSPPALDDVHAGFRQGQIHPDDIPSMIDLLLRFHRVSYLARAIDLWAQADAQLAELKREGARFRSAVIAADNGEAQAALENIDHLNASFTIVENGFSEALGEGSHWLERVVFLLLTLAVVMAEGVGLTLAFFTSRAISRGLADLNQTARQIGRGDFSRTARVGSREELGQLAQSLNEMGGMLQRSYSELEARVRERTAELERLASENAALARTAQEAVRARDEFISIASHELRNPLAPIVMALELMKSGSESETQRAIIDRQVRHLARLVDDLLDVSRITRGQVSLHKERLSLADVVGKSVEMAAPLFAAREQETTLSLGPDLWVEGDAIRLAQVVSNLLTNAAKYTERGGHIAVSAERTGHSVLLRVRDDGMGIAPEMLPRVFDLFVQERQALDRAQGGLGLGLAIVRSLVSLHGGEVSVTSAGVGRGSEFTIRLPAGAVREASTVMARAAARPAVPACEVLAVDDNADALAMLSECLQLLGHQAHCAVDGAQALAVAAQRRPLVAVLDIGLPEMDGYELAGRLRALPGLSAIKLIALSGYGQPQDRERSQAAGFNLHLVKPVTMTALRDAIAIVAS